ncbi:DUF5666 domain-containing protein [Planotetraspora phitsanulokensis]|uniref:DUF5666 domain-containing protein n=1 Tax=Planotetraspora phitsanulokensis TaxID=575192 RepID=A0A8J3UFR4_9ACTN|nr:DUF5666 domain-containing protein [Planotetraspora phitsanulokensis]GII42481.1 hypothetical protein Pph01_74840 [Planotetraspora phitsanulokensis]
MRKQANRFIIAGSVAGALAVGVLGGAAIADRQGTDVSLTAGGEQAGGKGAAVLTAMDGKTGKAARPGWRALKRRGLGVHGEATVKKKDGFVVRVWQRGDVTGAAAGTVTVKSADGTSWTWKVDGDTRVRKDGKKAEASALAAGDTVFVAGTRTGDTRTSIAVVAPKKAND